MNGKKGLKDGTTMKKPVHVCMVIDCPKTALFKNATSRRVKRGFCRAHREYAIPNAK